MGRPSKYKPEYAKQAEKLCLLGATDQELADFFEVEVRTVYRWKGEYPDFCQALKSGKEEADARVERSLYQQAIGYEQDEVKIFMPAQAEAPVYAPYRAKVAPNVTAAIFWLKNRKSQDWRDKQQTELTGPDGGPIETATSIKLIPLE
ncbi:terminase [Stenotrophomonas pavanii]|uniref:Terminase n=1 Tax=Stenotrophomonas pavanii TaxID=487698 RepID=A0A246KUP3_9GAMM|nr:terminase [Stenotrophomonas pavanii]OWR28959.1 terminase [Stenotrophomonas pavanii]